MSITRTFSPAEFALLKYAVRRAQLEEENEAKTAMSDLCRTGCTGRAKQIEQLMTVLEAA